MDQCQVQKQVVVGSSSVMVNILCILWVRRFTIILIWTQCKWVQQYWEGNRLIVAGVVSPTQQKHSLTHSFWEKDEHTDLCSQAESLPFVSLLIDCQFIEAQNSKQTLKGFIFSWFQSLSTDVFKSDFDWNPEMN